MKTIINKLLTCGLLLATFALHTACSDWNEPEAVDLNINSAKEQNPELWARYIQVLRSYKQSKHFITYARFDNSTENPVNEGSYLRSLPDSMDIVTLSHSDKISDYDRRDIPLLQEKSTRILYLVDFAAQASNLADAGALNNWLDKAITAAADLNLDGFAFTGIPLYGGTDAELAAHKEKSRLIVSRLSAAAGQDKLLIFEGDTAFVDAADQTKLSYIVLGTDVIDNATDLKLQVSLTLSDGSVPQDKLLLAARIGKQMNDEVDVKFDAVTLMTDYVASLGPLGGLAIYAIGDDYYHSLRNYATTRSAIQLMNPAN